MTRTLPDMKELLARLVAIEETAVDGSDAMPSAWRTQEGFPYWTNQAGRMEFQSEFGEEMVSLTATILATLYVGHASADYHGELDDQLASSFLQIADDLNRSARAQSALYNDGMKYLSFVVVSEIAGVQIRNNSDGQGMLCTVFTIQATFTYPQQYDY